MAKYALTIWFFALFQTLVAQPVPIVGETSRGQVCGATGIHRLAQQNEGYDARWQAFENEVLNFIHEGANRSETVYSIPVVVHIVHNGGPENISNSQVLAAIGHLNDAFRNRGVFDSTAGVDVEIEFCLAASDTNGNFTDGINRVMSPLTTLVMETQDLALKSTSHWNTEEYLNIWVVRDIGSNTYGNGISGYAYGPAAHGTFRDGIVVESRYFGLNADNSKILVHEAGHYLGLYHTFEGGCPNADCQTSGDRVCDTPPDASTAAVPCSGAPNSCLTDEDDLSANNPFRPVSWGGAGDQSDQFQNYMDYGHLPCQNRFTAGQRLRMQAALMGARASLLSSTGCQNPCPLPVTVNLSASATTGAPGTTISFSSSSSNTSSLTWKINGNSFASGSSTNYTFTQAGIFEIRLVGRNSNPGCADSTSIMIEIQCPIQLSANLLQTQILPGDSAQCTGMVTGGSAVGWLVDGIFTASGGTANIPFPNAGFYTVTFVGTNGSCQDTSGPILVQVGSCIGNKRANRWFFGQYAGLDFSNGFPIVDTTGALNTLEGCAAMCATDGTLALYTDGLTVWNREHNIMPNGTGLYGNRSSSQSALIVPAVGQDSLYYIFTTGNVLTPWALSYSLVDMRADSGRGAVTVKNVNVLTPVVEKLTGVRHCNGEDYWIITHGRFNDRFYAYHLGPNGLDTVPVISQSGVIPPATNNGLVGCLKASPDGSKLAAASNWTTVPASYNFETFDFDNRTGEISNPVMLNLVGDYNSYDVAFSQDGKLLYGSAFPSNWPNPDYLWQFDLGAGTAVDIVSNAINLTSSGTGILTGMQMGPDGRIYVSKGGDSLGIIENPSVVGFGANYVSDGIYLETGRAQIGLPNFVNDYFYDYRPQVEGDSVVCAIQQGVEYKMATGNCFLRNTSWQLLGNGTLTYTTDSSATVNFNGAGWDTLIVAVELSCGQTLRDTLPIRVRTTLAPQINLGADTALCSGGSLLLDPGSGFAQYLWQDGSTTPTFSATTAGIYTVSVLSTNGCTNTDTLEILQVGAMAPPELGPDDDLCPGQILSLSPGPGYQSYLWQDGSTNSGLTIWLPGTIAVTVTDYCGNTFQDSVQITAGTGPQPMLGPDLIRCPEDTVVLAGPAGFASYLWMDGTSGDTLRTRQPGWAWLEVVDSAGCAGRDSLLITHFPVTTPDLGPDTLLCLGESLVLDASGPFLSWNWSTGDMGSQITVTDSGGYTVTVTDANGCVTTDSIWVEVDVCDGLNMPENLGIDIFPNPSDGVFWVHLPENFRANCRISLRSARGREVAVQVSRTPQGYEVNAGDLAAGLYLLVLRTQEKVFTHPVLLSPKTH